MTASDLTVEILKQIRDGVALVAERVDHLETRLTERIDHLTARVDNAESSLGRRLDRVEQGLTDLGTLMREIAGDQARHERWLTQHVERELGELKARMAKVESATGLRAPE